VESRHRILALDVGRKRIGIAISDPFGTAHGLDTLQRKTMREDITRLHTIARERGVGLFLIGLPLHMSGQESEMSAFVRTFAERLESHTGIPVQFQDERLTSVEAESFMQDSGMSLNRMLDAKRKGAVDRLAAVILLEDYLRAVQPAE